MILLLLLDTNEQFFHNSQIYNLMKHDSYQRFLKSDIFAKSVKKEASGKELPQLDIKTGRIKKSSHTFFNWTHGSSFKGSNPVSSNRHKRLSLSIRPRSLNLETGSESTPSVASSKATSVSLSSSHRDLSPSVSSYERESTSARVTFPAQDNHRETFRPLPGSPTTVLSCFNTSPIQSSVSDDLLPSDKIYPSPPPVNLVRRNFLLSNPVPLCSTKYDFFSTTQSDVGSNDFFSTTQSDVGSKYKSNLEKAEDDLLSSIISASQRAPKMNTDGLPDFDSPRDLYRFLSQPDLMSPAFMDTTTSDEPSNEKRMGAYLSPSLGDVPKECLGIEGQISRKTKKRGHRLHPPPIPSGKSRPLAPLPPSSGGSTSSGAGRTPLKRITTNNFDPYSSILV